jgi:hypothetical protein
MSTELPKPTDSTATAPPRPPTAATSAPTAKPTDLPLDELEHLAEEFGLDPGSFKTRQHLVAALAERKQLIVALDREAMLDVVRWGRRPVAVNATKEQIALEIARVKSMRFEGLSVRGLMVLAQMRGLKLNGKESPEAVARMLHKQEGLFARFARRRRAFVGKMIAGMLGEAEAESEYQFLPPQQSTPGTPTIPPNKSATIADEIEESGLLGGLASRVKKTADVYLNQKLDEIEQRIDRKLDEIDRRLADWRDKEIANRIRIIKITLWASVVVAAVSLLYTYIKVYFASR